MQRDALYLADMIEATRRVAAWLDGITPEEWDHDEMRRSGVLWQLVIIGEAASSLSAEIRTAIPDVPWQQIRGFRNRAIHQYFGIDWTIVWTTATTNISNLEQSILSYLRREHPDVAKRFDEPDN